MTEQPPAEHAPHIGKAQLMRISPMLAGRSKLATPPCPAKLAIENKCYELSIDPCEYMSELAGGFVDVGESMATLPLFPHTWPESFFRF